VGIVAGGAFIIATWTFLRLQGVETWEATRRQSWLLTAALIATFAAPVVIGDVDYDAPAPRPNNAPAIPQLFARGNGSFALTDPGGPMPVRCCGTILNRDATPISTDESTKQDLLILLPVDTSRAVRNLTIQAEGQAGLTVIVDPSAVAPQPPPLEAHIYDADAGPATPDGKHIRSGWIARVPVTLNPTQPWDIGGDRYPLALTVNYVAAGDPPRTVVARTAVTAQVGNGLYEMAVAGSVIPICCFAAAIARWRRTR